MKQIFYTLLGLIQVFIGTGAIAGGIPMILNPNGMSQGLSTDILAASPFSNFLIPGVLLVLINGAGSLTGAYFSLNRKKHSGILGMALGIALIIWIAVQIFYINLSSWLQPTFLFVGISELVLGWLVYKQERKFGLNQKQS